MSEMQSDVGNFCTPQGLSTHQDWVPNFIKGKKKSAKHPNALEKVSFCHRASAQQGRAVRRWPVAEKMRKEVEERMGADCTGP